MSKTEEYRGYKISTDGSPFTVDGDTVHIQHDISIDAYYAPCGYSDKQETPLDAAKKYIAGRLAAE